MYYWNLPDPLLNTWVSMNQAFYISSRAIESELGRHQTTLAQFHILLLLDASKGPMALGELASCLFREPNSVFYQLNRMQKAGLVTKVRDKDDQRVARVSITPKGKELLDQAKSPGLQCAHNLLASCLSQEETQQLDKLLKKVRDHALERLGMKAEPLPNSLDAAKFLVNLT